MRREKREREDERGSESSNRAKYTREYVLSEFWQIFVEDRFVRTEATPNTNTLTTKICVLLRYGSVGRN